MDLQLASTFMWLSLTLLFLYFLSLTTQKLLYGRNLPPGPRPLPIIGNLHLLGDQPHRSLASLAKTYGPVMSLRLGQVVTVAISSPEMACEVLHKKDKAFANRWVFDALRALGFSENSSGWLPAAQQWRDIRRLYNTKLFTPLQLDSSESLRSQKINQLLDYVRENCVACRPIDVGRAAFTAMINLLSSTIFSVDLLGADSGSESMEEYLRDLVLNFMEEIGKPNISDCFPWLRSLDLQGIRRRFGSHLAKIHKVFDEQIDRRLKAVSEGAPVGNDFLGVFFENHNVKPGAKIDGIRLALKTLLSELFAAGSDTSSNTVEWAMTELLRNPKAMLKARTELATVIGKDHAIVESDIGRLPYLQAVVKETFRLHPPVPFLLPRKTEEAVEISGYIVPKHARVLVNVWAIGRDPTVWSDPEKFMPDRFLQGHVVELMGRNFELTPFGAGRRICPGLPLAHRMVHLMLASLLHGFEWRLPDGMAPEDVDIRERFGITLAKAVPLLAVPVPPTS